MKKSFKIKTIACALMVAFAGSALADEINPFTGAHGELEKLRLETEIAQQKNKLLQQQIEEAKNRQILMMGGNDPDKPGFIDQNKSKENQGGGDSGTEPGKDAEAEKKEEPKPEPVVEVKPKPKPSGPSYRLEGIFSSDGVMKAVISNGGQVAVFEEGSKLGRAVITRIEDNQVVLSNKRVLKFRGGNHTLSSGIAPVASTPGMPGQMPVSGMGYDAEVNTMMGANGVPVYVEPQPAQFK